MKLVDNGLGILDICRILVVSPYKKPSNFLEIILGRCSRYRFFAAISYGEVGNSVGNRSISVWIFLLIDFHLRWYSKLNEG